MFQAQEDSSMSLSSAFRAVGNDPGIITWRIEKMELALVPLSAHGSFYEGDCYIILSTRRVGSLLSQDIHFWNGKDSSQDEQSCAAIYTTQLDDYLGGSPVQHREKAHRSVRFCGSGDHHLYLLCSFTVITHVGRGCICVIHSCLPSTQHIADAQ
ncbi:Advillin [Camelus dromedarius]|uniref:Advillin n=1 Tax=Camelus dromedarius TaxID=9838 RepID=A0A5N4DFU8_CAMDR|nr:Advillin [Camelus dromedarius]